MPAPRLYAASRGTGQNRPVYLDRLPPGQPARQRRHAREFGQRVRRTAIVHRPRHPVGPPGRQFKRANILGLIERDGLAAIGRHRVAVSDLVFHE
jgi:hypothetical protein